MSTIGLDTKKRILKSAMDIIAKEGNLNVTTREIAQRAQVNVAAINYHFGSKDNLIEQVENKFVGDIKDIYSVLHDESLQPRDRIWIWADRLMIHLLEHPGILFMWASKVMSSSSKDDGIAGLIDYSEANLARIIKETVCHGDDIQISFKVMQLISSVISPILIYESGGRSLSTNIKDDQLRGQYIDTIIDNIL